MVNIGGSLAYSLFNTGCTTGVVSNEFAGVTKMPTFLLNKPIVVELGMSGSRGTISNSAYTHIEVLRKTESPLYMDVGNLSRYDAIIGKPLMKALGVVPDPVKHMLWVDGKPWNPLSEDEEADVTARRHGIRPRKE